MRTLEERVADMEMTIDDLARAVNKLGLELFNTHLIDHRPIREQVEQKDAPVET